ncbi:putative uncharacterized protein [Clostridium sp. CAG:762]|jgi:hypothetical protein|nr:putative uncharacterized protein [Clostridium sp. CAG:762]
MEILIVAIVILFIMEYSKKIDSNKFFNESKKHLNILKEDDYEFLLRAKYGEKAAPDYAFSRRIRNGIVVTLVLICVFLSKLSFINVLAAFIVGYLIFKSEYRELKRYYKVHLHEINMLLPYYLKNIEILIHHYTVPVALAKSIDDAPDIFKPGLKTLIDRINAGDSTIDPYMDFAKEYPVRDSMRMMRLLYRLSLGAQENKHEQLLTFSKSISNLQSKSREQKYKDRLSKMENKTMTMLVCTGGGAMILLLISIFMMMSR